ncbi:unnamed protein product [Ectocarpus sp. CCAP 1310/34]|nr:unnamed protein product [Ectocarpus sp. CCAP 1310/34]
MEGAADRGDARESAAAESTNAKEGTVDRECTGREGALSPKWWE